MTGSDARVRDVPVVMLTAGRLVARHWPALLALAFLGTGLRAQLQRLSPDDEKYDEVFRQLMVTEQRRQRYSGYERG